jgi:H+/Cl- antiporter ClcA
VEVTIVGAAQYSALVPCVISGITAAIVSGALGSEAESFLVSGVPTFGTSSVVPLLLVAVIGIVCALVSILFCETMHKSGELFKKYIPNPYLRVAAGGLIVVILTVILGTTDYNGAGMDVIKSAFEGNADSLAFLIKIVFTAITLGCGFKGGEIVPSFFIGATLGCTLGGLLGLSPSFGAAVGLIAVFCGVTNCPFASIILSAELFGLNGIVYYALAIVISYMLSGYTGLYSEQKFYQSKFRPVRFERNK